LQSTPRQVREYHRQYWEEGRNTRDVLIVAHGHFSRCLIPRWAGMPLTFGTHFLMFTRKHFQSIQSFRRIFQCRSWWCRSPLPVHELPFIFQQIAMLGYSHHSLKEPVIDALNLHAHLLP
jgi:hypothetical protein